MKGVSESRLARRMDVGSPCDEGYEAHLFESRPAYRPELRWSWTSTQLEPGALSMASTMRKFDDLLLQETTVNQTSLHRFRAPPDSLSLIIRSRCSGAQFVDGYELTQDSCVILNGGAEIELIAHPRSSWILISLSNSLMEAATPAWLSGSISLHAGVHLVKVSTSTCFGLEGETANALFRSGYQSVVLRIVALTMNALRDAADRPVNVAPPCSTRDGRACRRLAVERARRYIRDHLADPIRLGDLCAHAHLQARCLEYGFRELVRLSPVAYVRTLRLGEVRAQLLDDTAEKRSISQIALDTGFCHLSQFVVDYKRVFGETPSATRRGALVSIGLETRPRRRKAAHVALGTHRFAATLSQASC